MVRSYNGIRLIIELLCGLALILFIGGVMLAAAIMVGWAMALGMMIVFTLEFINRVRRHN